MGKYVLTVTANPALDKFVKVHHFKTGTDLRAQVIYCSAGGKGINVSRALKSLKIATLATGFIGGQTGEYIRRLLAEEQLAFDFIQIPQDTRTNLTISDSSVSKITRLIENGPQAGSGHIKAFYQKFMTLVKDSYIVVISGRNIEGATDDFYKVLVEIAHRFNKKVVLDSNGQALLQGIKAHPFMIKPNHDEAEYVLRMRLSSRRKWREALEKFLDMGIKNVCITLGKQGALATDGQVFLHAQPPPQEIANTVGCGDAFIAGFIFPYLKGHNFKKCLQNAAATATANVLNIQPGYLVRSKVKQIARLVRIETL